MEVEVKFNDGEVRVFNYPSPDEIKAERAEFDKMYNKMLSMFGSFDSIVQSED